MHQEYDVVKLTHTLSELLPAGMTGTVLIVHDVAGLPRAYEVEFLDAEGRTIAVLTAYEQDIAAV